MIFRETSRSISVFIRLRSAFLLFALPVGLNFGLAQNASVRAPSNPRVDYTIGPGDILIVSIAESPELSGKYRITQTGYLVLPMVPRPIRAEGLSPRQISQAIAESLKTADLVREPTVNVFVEEYHSRTLTVLGAVAKPSVYPLEKPTTVLEALSVAGGLIPTSGNELTLIRNDVDHLTENSQPGDSAKASDSRVKIDLAKLLKGEDPSLNILVRPGDVISVAAAPVVYIVGAVIKPGGYVLQDPASGITILQALAMAEGLNSIAAPNRTLIIRRASNGEPKEKIQLDLKRMLEGRLPDRTLEANDIVFVPESRTKKNVMAFTREGVSGLVTGVSIYGLGPRIAR